MKGTYQANWKDERRVHWGAATSPPYTKKERASKWEEPRRQNSDYQQQDSDRNEDGRWSGGRQDKDTRELRGGVFQKQMMIIIIIITVTLIVSSLKLWRIRHGNY